MTDINKNTKSEKLILEFLSNQKIVLADSSSVSRSRLKRLLKDLGAKEKNIFNCSTYSEAQEVMEKEKPKVVLTEFKLGKSSGFDLLRQYRQHHKNCKDNLFILVTSSGGQSLVARAAEEAVDTFILKPYTVKSLKETLTKSILNKIYPSDYIKEIEKGKDLLFSGNYKDSKKIFLAAQEKSKKPTLACFYYAQAEMMEKSLKTAKEKFEEGLAFNKIHFKCLIGLFDLLNDQKRYPEAYEVVRKIAKYFPANPERLTTVIRLAILTNNISDIEEYFAIFEEIDEKTDQLIKAMSAGLIICGKTYLSKDIESRGLELLEKSAIISMGDKKFLRMIIDYLLYYGHLNEIEPFFKRFHQEDRISKDYIISSFILSSIKLDPLKTIMEAQNLLQKNIRSSAIYLLLVQNLCRNKRMTEANRYIQDCLKIWPEKQYYFDGVNNKYNEISIKLVTDD